MRSEKDIRETIDEYGDTVKRICFVYMKNQADTEDIFQDVFLKYALEKRKFESPEHKKAWILRVAINRCKDILKRSGRNHLDLEEALGVYSRDQYEEREIMEAVLSLPEKYRQVVYLHYYEGYKAEEISSIIGKRANTVYTLLARARKMLKVELGGEEDGR